MPEARDRGESMNVGHNNKTHGDRTVFAGGWTDPLVPMGTSFTPLGTDFPMRHKLWHEAWLFSILKNQIGTSDSCR